MTQLPKYRHACVLALALLLIVTATALAGDWPQWRGPARDGISDETNLPVKWSESQNIAWKTPIPGIGHSSPIIWGDRVFVTSCDQENQLRIFLCISRLDGSVLWRRDVLKGPLEKKNSLNSYASSTPATDGQHVYVSFLDQPNTRIICYDMDGKEVWRQSPGTFKSMHGFCSSPLIYKDLLIVNCDQDDVAYILAYDKNSGKEVWRTDRPNKTRSYVPPVIINAAGKQQMVLSGSKCVASYDPETGQQNWIIDGPTEQFVASLVYTDGVLFVTYGFPLMGMIGVDPSGSGNVTNTHVLWKDTKDASYVPSPVALGKYVYIVSDKGVLSCVEAKTGKKAYSEKLGKSHYPSGVYAGGHLYFLSDQGEMFVIKPGPIFDLVGRNPIGEECRASPAVSHGQIFIRGQNHLFCIGQQ